MFKRFKRLFNKKSKRKKEGHYNKYIRSVPGDVYYMDKNDLFSKYIKKRKDVDVNGFYDVIAHGSVNNIQVKNNGKIDIANHRDASKMIKRNKNYKGQSIRLLSCSTGASSKGFAQNLANKLNVVVEAPTKLVWAYSSGNYVVADRRADKPNQPDLKKRGKFLKYYPGGKQK